MQHLNLADEAVENAITHFLRVFQSILLISGAVGVNELRALQGSFKEKVQNLVSDSVKIQKAIGEDIASCDFKILCPLPDTTFERSSMEDADNCRRKSSRGEADGRPILCATELGLIRREKLASGDGKVDTVTLIRAKVVLGATRP